VSGFGSLNQGIYQNEKPYESPLSKAKRHLREVEQRLNDLVTYREQVEQRILADKRELAQIDEVIGMLANAPVATRDATNG
jgi:flagellar biosynthesis chaperone FliJ